MTNIIGIFCIAGASLIAAACGDKETPVVKPTEKFVLPELVDPVNLHKDVKSPLGFNPYIDLFKMEQQGVPYWQMDISSDRWDEIIDMVATKLKPYGYEYIITDGFIEQKCMDETGYMTHYGTMSIKELVRRCKEKGLKVGIYDNCFWVRRTDNTKVPGTNYSMSSLLRNPSDIVAHPEIQDNTGFCHWLVTDHPGAKEYIDGFFKHYADLGVDYVFMDFNDWYENGYDAMRGYVSCGYGRERYERGLSYMAEAAQKYGVKTSCGLSWHYNQSELESKYYNYMRVDRDMGAGGWDHISDCGRNLEYKDWLFDHSQFDAFTWTSPRSGRDKVKLNGDMLLLSACKSDGEKRFTVSISLLAGGPVISADNPELWRDSFQKFYCNEEMLALNKDGFVGKPMDATPGSEGSNIWYGEMTDGDVVVGFFNREPSSKSYTLDIADIGLSGSWSSRDLWTHTDGNDITKNITVNVAPHDVCILRLKKK